MIPADTEIKIKISHVLNRSRQQISANNCLFLTLRLQNNPEFCNDKIIDADG
jgi:hypothetical protein